MLAPEQYTLEAGPSYLEKGDFEDNTDPESRKAMSPFAEGYEEPETAAAVATITEPDPDSEQPPEEKPCVAAYELFRQENMLCLSYSDNSPSVFGRSRDQHGSVWDYAYCNRCYMFAMKPAEGDWTLQRTIGNKNFFHKFDAAHWWTADSATCWDSTSDGTVEIPAAH